jgi:hypothetical protein
MKFEELSKEDKGRVKNTDGYIISKHIMAAFDAYKDLNVGEVYLIKDNNRNSYVTRNYGSSRPDKFMIFYKDGGFIFVKRINSNGKLGKEVVCLTTRFMPHEYTIEPDPNFVDAIIFGDEAGYDPSKEAKEYKNKKNKARIHNNKNLILYDDSKDAKETLDKYIVGDLLWDCKTSYGEGVVEWEVVDVEKRKVDKTPINIYGPKVVYGTTNIDQIHNKFGIEDVTILTLSAKDLPKSRRWIGRKRKITFIELMKGFRYKYYNTRPISPDDIP